MQVERVELIGREQPRHRVEHVEAERVVHVPALVQRRQHLGHRHRHQRAVADPPPELVECCDRALLAAAHETVGEHHGVHRAGAGAAQAVDEQTVVAHQALQHAPREGAVGTAALQRQIDAFAALVMLGVGGHTVPVPIRSDPHWSDPRHLAKIS